MKTYTMDSAVANFDGLLIAQSLVENLPVITSDAAFDRYPIQRVW